jgi:capsular polysaccharide biosynthesis protein
VNARLPLAARSLVGRVRGGHESPWAEILGRGIPERSGEGAARRVLFATSVGSHPVARVVDSLVAMSLWIRGAEPTFLLCNGVLAACEACSYVDYRQPQAFLRDGPSSFCRGCFATGADYYSPLPTPVRRYGEFADDARVTLQRASAYTLEDCFTLEEAGLGLGEQVRAATLRFFGKADLRSEPAELVLGAARRYAAGAITTARVADRAFQMVEPECVVGHHGIYVPQGVIGEVARRDGVRVVAWGTSYRNTTVLFSHGDTYHHTLIDEPVREWDAAPLTSGQEGRLTSYLVERAQGKGDWTWITPEAALRGEVQEREQLVDELGLDPTLPIVGLLTNVLWDAQLYYESQAFPDMLEWLWTTIDYFVEHPGLQLIVRIHPHEVKIGNRQPVEPELRQRYSTLPSNIHVIPFDHPYNTYALMQLCRAVLIYGTKTGVELAAMGTPVIVAGEAWIRGKGITHDASTRDEYLGWLDVIPRLEPLDDETRSRARRYAYHYFFRRMIPLRSLDPDGGVPPRLRIAGLDELRAGRDPGLDVICEGLLDGGAFVYDRT